MRLTLGGVCPALVLRLQSGQITSRGARSAKRDLTSPLPPMVMLPGTPDSWRSLPEDPPAASAP